METDWAKLRNATQCFRETALQVAKAFVDSPHFQEEVSLNIPFSDFVWEFVEEILVSRFLLATQNISEISKSEAIIKEVQQIFTSSSIENHPWTFSKITPHLVQNQPDLVQECFISLKEIPCDLEHVWLLGSLYEYRTGLLIECEITAGENQLKLVKNPLKKRQAIYYTPRDVVDFILQHSFIPLLQEIKRKGVKGNETAALSSLCNLSVLDPSCGGGAFLVPAWQYLIRFFTENFPDVKEISLNHQLLVGIDIDPLAARVARFSLWLTTPRNHPLVQGYAIIEGNALWPGKSEFIPRFSFPERFPNLFGEEIKSGFGCIIGNPPYAEIPPTWPDKDLAQRFRSTASKDLYTLFLEQMVLLSNHESGRGGMIVPLSLTFSKDMRSIRDFIVASGCHWKISSYHIRPSGIFPGISQRTSIVLVEPSPDGKTRVETTCVHRWSVDNRAKLFSQLQYADVTESIMIIANQARPLGFPNIGNPTLSSLLLKLLRREETLGQVLIRPREPTKDQPVLYYFTMAYHWLSVSAQLPDVSKLEKIVALSSLIPLYFANEADRWAAMALLASSLGFWWWQVFGDLFHVTRAVLSQFPVNPAQMDPRIKTKIIDLAKLLQEEVNKNVTFFTKKGVTNANFDLTQCFPKIHPIDSILKDYLHASTEEWDALDANYTETTGRNIK